MRKILFLLAIIATTGNVMGQTTLKAHKATGDKPAYSEMYYYFGIDSALTTETRYTYDNSQRIIKQISTYSYSQEDSTLTAYDAKGRIVSIDTYTDGILSSSQTWNYDDVNSMIEQHIDEDSEELSAYIVFYGVKDMDATDGGLNFSNPMLGGLAFRDCDSILMKAYDANTSGWNTYGKIIPKYQGGNITQATYTLDASLFADMVEGGIPFPLDELTIVFTFSYQSGKLTNMSGSTSIDVGLGFPLELSNFITITNQYYGNLLIETTSAIDISFMGQDVFYTGDKETYFYNQENNLLCTETYSSDVKNNWELSSKTWYYYGSGTSVAKIENTNMTLGQNIPNPASNSARIDYSVVEAGQVTFTLYSINGQTLLQQTEYATEGNHQLELNTTDLANGMYFYSMDFNGKRIVKKMNVKK